MSDTEFLVPGVVTPPGGSGNGGGGGLLISRQSELTSNHITLHSGWFLTKSSSREVDQQHNYNYYYSHHKSHLINAQPQASPILRKSVFNPGSVFFTGSGNTPSTNIYVQFWLTLVQLAQDPYPEVSRLATILIQYLYGKVNKKKKRQSYFHYLLLILPIGFHLRIIYVYLNSEKEIDWPRQ
ncbi:unnamed protein product [Schistosoma curassoni]|uniref:Uncharacterized protein n=1 Tax=Schistosoma curassoni TaxID=6186 RepID=A0A183L3E5_9TREM|nr:unnamed protein product [Schistosoma curassoni]